MALDLLRGLAVAILVVNHIQLESPLEAATSSVLSAAEVLVAVSGLVVGMVFGRRWLARGPRHTAGLLLRRAAKLYGASVVVVALVGLLGLVPGVAIEALGVSRGVDHYDFGGPGRTVLAIVTLEAGPWQFNIVSFFVAILAITPAILWALARGWWPAVALASWALYAAARAWSLEILPSQSEQPFPFLVWQVLFVNALVLGWHRRRLAAALRSRSGAVTGLVVAAGVAAAGIRLGAPAEWQARHLDKDTLDLLRIATMTSLTAAAYVGFGRMGPAAERYLGRLLLPLGRNSFYVFIMQVFVCLAIASVPLLDGGLGPAGNAAVQAASVGILWVMVRRGFLFRWVPR